MKQNTLLLRLLTAAIAVLAGAPAWGQTAYEPKIAFTQLSGKTTSLYLANEDGSNAVRVATTDAISGIDFAPNGNRIAFTDRAGLKVLTFTPLATGIRVDSIQTLRTGRFGSPDFSSDGSRLLYYQSASPSGYRAIPSTGGQPTFLHVGSGLGYGRWLQAEWGNAFAFLNAVPQGPNLPVHYEVRTVLLNASDQVVDEEISVTTTNQEFKSIEDFDIARTRPALLLSVNYPVGHPATSNIVEFDMVARLATNKAGPGYRSHYSSDDSRIIYRTFTYLGATELVHSLDLGTGVITQVFSSKKGLGITDARP